MIFNSISVLFVRFRFISIEKSNVKFVYHLHIVLAYLLGAFPFSSTSSADNIDIDSDGADRWDNSDFLCMNM